MRLQLALVLVWLSLAVGVASAWAQDAEAGEGAASSRVLVYDDNDATRVVTSILDVEATLPGQATIGAYALVDAISSASVDVVSAATGRWQETRVELGGRASAPLVGNRFSLGAARSQENDWLSHSVSVGSSRELFERNTLLSANYAFISNRVGRAMDPNFEKSLVVHSAEFAVGQLIDIETRGGVAYSVQRSVGFQSSPYRFVGAADGVALAERHPDTRTRHALSAFLLRALGESMSLRGSYRLYRDDWGIWSHSAALRVVYDISSRLQATLDGRYYLQNKADFYRGSYATSFRFMSADRELSSFWDLGGGAGLALALGPVKLDAKLSAIRYRFRNFEALPSRVALLIGGGAKLQW